MMNPFDWEPVWLVGGALLGVLVRAKTTSGQDVFSRETVVDLFVAAVIASIWNIPGTFDVGVAVIEWPLLPMPEKAVNWQRALLMAGLSWLFVHYVKMALITWAPTVFERLTGKIAPRRSKNTN